MMGSGDRQVQIYINNERLDLYNNENIVVSSSVQNVNDISKIFTDFSQSFTVPATVNNNRIFSHWYEADVSGGFDARIKQPASIEISYVPFREGKIRMESVKMKGGLPESYKITFFGRLTKLTDLFGEDRIKDLDLSAYDHDRDFAAARDGMRIGLTFGGPDDIIIYPLLSDQRQLYYTSDYPADQVMTDTLANIAYNNAAQTNGIQWYATKPAILVKEILTNIQSRYGVTFSTDFFGLSLFDELYMWLQVGEGDIPTTTGQTRIDIDTRDSGTPTFDLTTDSWTTTLQSTSGGKVPGYTQAQQITYTITPDVGYTTIPYTVLKEVDWNSGREVVAENVTGTTSQDIINRVPEDGNIETTMSLYIVADQAFNYSVTYEARLLTWNIFSWTVGSIIETVSGGITSLTPRLVMADHLPEIKVGDFFSALMKMFNLVIIPTSDTTFFIDTLENWYAAGTVTDISQYVDTKDYDISRGKTLSDINFVFEENDSILLQQRISLYGSSYGDIRLVIKDENGEVVEGEELTVEIPFTQLVYERLTDELTSTQTEIQYGAVFNRDLEPIQLEAPHLFFAENITGMTQTYSIIDNGGNPTNSSSYWKVSHVDSTGTYSLVFNNEVDEYTNTEIENTLYADYYSNYVSGIFSQKRRMYKYRAKLPLGLLSTLELNDKVIIDGRRYIINSMRNNLTKGTTEFELLNDIY